LRAGRAVPDVGVDPVREVDRRRTGGEPLDLALRREHENLVLENVDLERLDELLRVSHVVLPFEELTDPRELGLVVAVALAAFLVAPVRRDAVLREVVHVSRAHLDLDRLAASPDDRRVQRLVHVRLGHRDVVVELPRDRRPERVHHAKRGVAGWDVVDDDADREDVVDLFEADALPAHLLRDGPQVLGAAGEVGTDAGLLELIAERLHRFVDVALADLATCRELLGDLAVVVGLEELEREVLELPLDLPNPEAVRQRRVDVHGLSRYALLLFRWERRERSHVVESVAELDDHDAQVVGHREEHLSDVLGLMLVARLAGKARQLRDAVDETADLLAELAPHVLDGLRGVLGHVMQERRRDRRRIHAELRDEHRDRGRVRDVRLAGHALLAFVGLGRVSVRAADELRVALGVVAEYFLREGVGVDVAVALRAQPVGDADDPRRDRRSALCHYPTSTGAPPPARRSISAAVPTSPKSRSSSSTNPRRPVPMLTTASTRPASVIPSA